MPTMSLKTTSIPLLMEIWAREASSQHLHNQMKALENYKNRLHEVLVRKCAHITQLLKWVEKEVLNLSTYKGLPNLETLIS